MATIAVTLAADATKPAVSTRSSKWPAVRKKHLLSNSTCAGCGGTTKLEVHHIKPFHLFPELELEPSNLITLCESYKGGVNCHLMFGHLGNYSSYNVSVREDAYTWMKKFETRP